MQISNNKILITGGASGIGLGLSERFIQENNTVIVCGRRSEVLDALKEKHPGVITKVCDLSVEVDRISLYHWIAENHADLNVLINNAGIQNWMGVNDEHYYQKAINEVNTNIMAPLHLTDLFLKLSNINTIINVSSGLAFVPLTRVPVYCASKAFFHSYTLSLRHLLKDRNIEVIEMIPPALNTDLGGVGIHNEYPPVSDFVASIFEQLKEGKSELTFGQSEFMSKADPAVIQSVFQRMNP